MGLRTRVRVNGDHSIANHREAATHVASERGILVINECFRVGGGSKVDVASARRRHARHALPSTSGVHAGEAQDDPASAAH